MPPIIHDYASIKRRMEEMDSLGGFLSEGEPARILRDLHARGFAIIAESILSPQGQDFMKKNRGETW